MGLFLGLVGPHAAQAAERNLSFAVSGIVSKILVSPGQTVKAGQALAEMDSANISARLKAGGATHRAAALAHTIAVQRFDYAKEQFEAVSLSKSELDDARLDMVEAFAKLARIKSKIEVGKWRLAHMILRAPKAGKIVKIPGFKGMVVSLKSSVATVVTIDMP